MHPNPADAPSVEAPYHAHGLVHSTVPSQVAVPRSAMLGVPTARAHAAIQLSGALSQAKIPPHTIDPGPLNGLVMRWDTEAETAVAPPPEHTGPRYVQRGSNVRVKSGR